MDFFTGRDQGLGLLSPTPRNGLVDDDAFAVEGNVMTGAQILEYATDHFPRGSDPVGDVLLGQRRGNQPAVLLSGLRQ